MQIKTKFKINPLFFAVFFVFCFYEGISVTLIIYLSAMLHELGHFIAARLVKTPPASFSILPFGMRIELDFSKIAYKNQAVIAFAGPLFNIILWMIAVLVSRIYFNPLLSFFAASNFFLAAVNLVPAFPLDGGRITEALLCKKIDIYKAKQVADAITLISLLLLFGLGIYLLILSGYNFSLILISLVFLSMLLKDHIKEAKDKKIL